MSLPHLTSLYELYRSESQPFRKVHRMVDLFESVIKTYTAVMMAEYFRRNKVSDPIKGLLANGLRTPSLGTWQIFSRELFKELKSDSHVFTHPRFAPSFKKLDKDLDIPKTDVISFRNGYAHGATPSDEDCLKDIDRFSPFLDGLLTERWMEESAFAVRDGRVFLDFGASSLCLHPILVERIEPGLPSLAFFNDSKKDSVGLLNYPLSKHYREKDFYSEFLEFIPMKEWRRVGTKDFLPHIDELTDTFKGRLSERREMLDFVRGSDRGFLSVQGNPGVGKSALLAQFCKDLSAEDAKGLKIVPYFINRGTPQAQAEQMLVHLLKRTDDLFPGGRVINSEYASLWELQNLLSAKWRLWGRNSKRNKLLFLIDGLDEGLEGGILSHLPREAFKGIIFIYGSRADGHPRIRDLWTELPAEHHRPIHLKGLGKEDIRALIYEVADKYAIERESSWIDGIAERSEGNPLYLKLLCKSIENGSIGLNDKDALPLEIHSYYEAILNRYAEDRDDGRELLRGLYVFAAAKDYLTFSQLAAVNGLDEASLHRIVSTLREVLKVNPLSEDVSDYQIFHESFREYLLKKKSRDVEEAGERIIQYCSSWPGLEGSLDQRYALEHYAEHLYDSNRRERVGELMALMRNSEYLEEQKRVLGDFGASNRLCRLALLRASDLKLEDDLIEAALVLVELRHEESNDVHKVVEMAARGEIDYALRRLEAFGGNDTDGLRRKCTLYFLCLMELTLLSGKDKPFRRAAIERLLDHFDEHMPTSHSALEWIDFYPSYLVFRMACGWAELGLDYLVVYRRSDRWNGEWLAEIGPFTDLQFKVLVDFARDMRDGYDKSRALIGISTELARQRRSEDAAILTEESLLIARGISDGDEKSRLLSVISTELARQGRTEESLSIARGISRDHDKSTALGSISTELARQGRNEEAATVMQGALSVARGISSDYDKSTPLRSISTELSKQGKTEEALFIARGISGEYDKSTALREIAIELARQGKTQEALSIARGISEKGWNSRTLRGISIELAKQGKIEESLSIARGISRDYDKSPALRSISTEMAKMGRNEEAASVMEEALSIARGISRELDVNYALRGISIELAKQGKTGESLSCASSISTEAEHSAVLYEISNVLSKQGGIEEAATVMKAALASARGIGRDREKRLVLRGISTELAEQGKPEEALSIARGISDDYDKSTALGSISTELARQGRNEEAATVMQEALSIARGIRSVMERDSALRFFSTELAEQGRTEEALSIARGISSDYDKSTALRSISTELAKQGKIEECLSIARGISSDYDKSTALGSISTELARQGRNEEAATVMQEALSIARGIGRDFDKSTALRGISTELAKQGKTEEALQTDMEIRRSSMSQSSWNELVKERMMNAGWSIAFKERSNLQGEEASIFYLKGCVESIRVYECDAACMMEALPALVNDAQSVESLLVKHALNMLFFGFPEKGKIDRLNRTLNIRWAMESSATLPSNAGMRRLSSNLGEWLHEISDEDDRDMITIWARQVAKGRLSEMEFSERLRGLG